MDKVHASAKEACKDITTVLIGAEEVMKRRLGQHVGEIEFVWRIAKDRWPGEGQQVKDDEDDQRVKPRSVLDQAIGEDMKRTLCIPYRSSRR